VCAENGAPYCAQLAKDGANCGACGHVCPQGKACDQGVCSCPLTQCGSLCVDTQTDATNCGACGHSCATTLANELGVCHAGACETRCVVGFGDCDGVSTNGCEANLATDSADCGACARSCGTDACTSGTCPTKVIASGLTDPHSITIDGGFVYFATWTQIARVPTSGGNVETLATVNTPMAVATDGTYLVWGLSAGEVDSRLTSGGNVAVLWTNGQSYTDAIAIASGNAYFVLNGVRRAPLDGSAQAVLVASGNELDLVVDSTAVYAVDTGMGIVSAPLNAVNVTPATITKAPLASNLAIDANDVYWTEDNSGMIRSVPKNGGNTTTLASGQGGLGCIATDGAHVYWGAQTDAAIRRTFAGEPVLTLATGETTTSSIAVDASRVYWSSSTAILATVK